jgi:mono/diheme cytochrome c family protein
MQRHAKMVTAAAVSSALILGGIGLLIGGSAGAQNAAPGDAVEGKRLFLADGCFLCHGRVGEGGALNGPAPILAKTHYRWRASWASSANPSTICQPMANK